MRILVVDDEPDIHQLISVKVQLSGRGEVVGTATAMPEAVALAKTIQPDVVITDLVMSPTLGGHAYLDALRSVAPSAYVVVFTGYVKKADAPLPRGADAYVVKGGSLDPLMEAIEASEGEIPRTPRWTSRQLPSMARVALSSAEDQLTVEVTGEIDVSTAQEILAALLPAIDGGNRTVHLDLSAVDFIDAYGLRVLETANARAEGAGVSFVVLRPSVAARRLLEVAGLDTILDVADEPSALRGRHQAVEDGGG